MTSDILLTAIILFSIGVVFLIIVLTLKKTEKNFFSKCIAAKGIVISYQATAGSNNGSAPVVKFFDNGVEAKGKASVSNIFSKRVHVGEEVDILYVNKLVFGLPAYGIKILSNPDKSPNAGTVIANIFLAISLVTITASIVLCIMSTPS